MQGLGSREWILAHRGLWTCVEEENSLGALRAALAAGFGVETDIRDRAGDIVVSHDPPTHSSPRLDDVMEALIASSGGKSGPIAINVKSDGLLALGAIQWLTTAIPQQHFFFDMSFPQLLQYARAGMPVAVRVSEYEPLPPEPVLDLISPVRVWLDCFHSDWWLGDERIDELCRRYPVTVVSPELHGRDPEQVWNWCADRSQRDYPLSICTDHPLTVAENYT